MGGRGIAVEEGPGGDLLLGLLVGKVLSEADGKGEGADLNGITRRHSGRGGAEECGEARCAGYSENERRARGEWSIVPLQVSENLYILLNPCLLQLETTERGDGEGVMTLFAIVTSNTSGENNGGEYVQGMCLGGPHGEIV